MEVFESFDLDLFRFLAPPSFAAEIRKFEGKNIGDLVEIYFKFPINSLWVSEITALEINDNQAFFIDEGLQLPFGLVHWRHKHIIAKNGSKSIIIDVIEYRSKSKILDLLLYPFFLISFLPRKYLYKKYFNQQKFQKTH